MVSKITHKIQYENRRQDMKKRRGGSFILVLLLCMSMVMNTFAADIPDIKVDTEHVANEKQTDEESGSSSDDTQLGGTDHSSDSESNKTDEKVDSEGSSLPQDETDNKVPAEDSSSQPVESNLEESVAFMAERSLEWTSEDFTYGPITHTMTGCNYQREIIIKGQGITGFSESGNTKISTNKNLVIPSKMPDGTTIVGIASNAFQKQGIETVTLPEGMMIPYDDQLTGVVHERGNFVIMNAAFSDNNITSINFPDGVIYIDASAFRGNQLTTVTFPHTLWMIGNSAFAKNQITTVNFYKNCDFLFQMDGFAFAYNKIKSVTLPNYCEKLDKRTFILNPGMENVPENAPEVEKKNGGLVYMYTDNSDLFNRDRINHIDRTAESQKSWHQKLILGTQPEDNSTWKSEDFTYNGTVITGLSQSGVARRANDKDLVLPDKNPQGAYITGIGAGSATNCGTFSAADEVFDSVILPVKLETIGDYAFYNNNVSSFNVPTTLSQIGVAAFAQNKLSSVVLPDSVKTIGAESFSGQKGNVLTAITLSKGLIEIPQSAFAGNVIQKLVIPEGITSIGARAFQGNALTSLTIPGGIKVISSGAFAQNEATGNMTELIIKEGIQEIADNAFANARLQKVTLPSSLTKLDANAFQGGKAGKVELDTDNYMHLSNKVDFPESTYHWIKLNTASWKAEDFTYSGTSITGLSDSGIIKRTENKKLVLPAKTPDGKDVTDIAAGTGSYGTFGIEGEVFEQVVLPEKLQTIGDKAFLNNHLTNVEFPTTLSSIGMQAFAMNDFSEVILPNSLKTLGGAAFLNNVHLQRVELSSQMTEIAPTVFGITLSNTTNASLTRVVIPEGVKTIGMSAFAGQEIQTLILPTSLSTIGSKAFKDNQLEQVIIPADVTELGSSAFEQPAGRNKLQSVKLVEGLLKINSKTFANANLTRVDIPFSLTTLNKAAFSGNKNGNVAVYTPNDEHMAFEVTGATFEIHIRTDIWTSNDFSYNGTMITGLSEKGVKKRVENHNLVLPDKNPSGEYITEIAAPASGSYGTFSDENQVMESVVLPSKLQKVGDRAFQNNNLTEIAFPETLTEIGLAAFQKNQLARIILPNSVTTMGGGAFGSNKTLQSVTLSSKLTDIPAGAFGCSGVDYMEGFSEIIIPEGVKTIGNNAFAGNNFTNISIPSTVTSIGNYAFSTSSALTSSTVLTLSEGLETIGSRAFRNQNIASVNLPYTVQGLSANVFEKQYTDAENAITKVRVQNYTQYTDKEKFKDSTYHEYEINADSYSVWDFTYNGTVITGLSQMGELKRPLNKNLVLPNQNVDGDYITEIAAGKPGEYGTFGVENEIFEAVILPVELKKIGNFAFRDNRITTIVFPEKLENIGIQAFAQNTLEDVVLPDSVTTLGGAAFTSNSTLKRVVLSKNISEIPASAFLNNTSAPNFVSVTIPEGVASIGNMAFAGNSFSEVVIPTTVTKIGSSAFAQTPERRTITKVKLPSGLVEIGAKAFKDSALTRIDIPRGLQKLAKDTFTNAGGTVVSIHSSNKEHLNEVARKFYPTSDWHQVVYDQMIESGWTEEDFTYDGPTITGWSEQGNQTRLQNHKLVLPTVNPITGEDITVIGNGAFKIPEGEWEQGKTGIYSPNGMESVQMPERLQAIGANAFQYNSLKGLTFPNTLYSIGESAFNSNKIKELILPDTITEIQSGAFSANVMDQLTLSKGLTKISQATFSMNIDLTHVEIPESITEIGDYAFAGAKLESLDIPKAVTRIGKKAFHLHHLTELVVPGNVKEIGDSAFEGTFKGITLKKLVLEEGIEKIGSLAFKEGYLESVNLPSTLTSLGNDAFYHNAGIDNDYIVVCYTTNPALLKFQNSDSHRIVYQAAQWNTDDFIFGTKKASSPSLSRMMAIPRATVDEITISETTITGLSEKGIKKLETYTDLVLPQRNSKGEVITAIGDMAFANLPRKLTSVVFSDGLKSIGEGAFQGNALTELLLPGSLESIGAKSFAGNQLTELTLPESVVILDGSAFDGNTDINSNPVKVKVYITSEKQASIIGSDGFEIVKNYPGQNDPDQNNPDGNRPTDDVTNKNEQGNQVAIKANGADKKSVKKASKTSDGQLPELYTLLMVAAIATLGTVHKRKKKLK